MASNSTEMNKTHQIRSLSLPSKLNPINQKIEKELKRLKIKEESATSTSGCIIIGVSGLAELYECINQALSLPRTQQSISLRQHETHVGEVLKRCSSLLNVCTSVMEVVLLQGAITKVLESSLSETTQDYDMECNISIYNSSRKELIKKTKNANLSLNQLNDTLLGEEEECTASTVIKSLRCVSIINLSVFESLLSFLSMPVSKPKKSLVSKMMNKKGCKCETGNEITDVDNVLHQLVLGKSVSGEKFSFSVAKLKGLVGVMEEIENGLKTMSKQLSVTKSCLMNIVSF